MKLFERTRTEEMIESETLNPEERRWLAESLVIDIRGIEQALYAINELLHNPSFDPKALNLFLLYLEESTYPMKRKAELLATN